MRSRRRTLAARYTCPVELTLDVIGGKWKPLILWELRGGARRFNALQEQVPGIAHKVLTEQLRDLERADIIARTQQPRGARHVEYKLSDFGRTLRPALDAMAKWAKRHHRHLGVALDW